MKKTLSTILLGALAALAGCDLEAEAKADRVCVNQPLRSSAIPGVPIDVGVVDNTQPPLNAIPVTFPIDIGSAVPDLDEKGVEARLDAQSIALTTLEGADLSGVELVQFTVAGPPGANLPDVVFTYTKPANAAQPVLEAAATPATPVDLVPYVRGQQTLDLKNILVRARPPAQSWTPALRTCVGTDIDVDYLEAAGL